MSLSLRIAWRFIWKYKSQSILIVLGIAVGISVLIFIGSLIKGLQVSLIDTAIGRISQITIVNENEDDPYIRNYDVMVKKLNSFRNQITVATPTLTLNVYAVNGELDEPISIKGIQMPVADQIYKLNENIKNGKIFGTRKEIVVGVKLAEKLKVGIGEKITLKTVGSSSADFYISGIFDLKNETLNKTLAFTSLSQLQSTFGFSNRVSQIEMQVSDVFQADVVAKNIPSLGREFTYKITNWKDSNRQLLTGLNSQTVSTIMIQTFVLISVVLGIASVLAVSVMQKSKQIGILKAMGMNNSTTSWIFIYQGAILSLIGIVVGVGLGFGLIYGFVVGTSGSETGIIIRLDSFYILQVCALSFVMASLSVLIPARRTKQLDPIEVIKNG